MESINWTQEQMLEVILKEPDDFLKVRETLSRIGVASRKERTLYQSNLKNREKIGLVPTSRAAGSFIAINSVVCEEDEYDVEKIESSLLTDLPLLIDSMEMRFSQYDLIYGSDEIESNANLEQYFEAVKNSILTTNGI